MSQKQTDTKKKQTVARAEEKAPEKEKNKKESSPKETHSAQHKKTPAKESKKTAEGKEKEKNKGKDSAPSARAEVSHPRSERMIHQAMPYILFVATLFLGACYIFHDSSSKVGVLGGWIHDLFTGLFGWPAFLIPLILINLAIFWRKYVDMCLVGAKLLLSFLTVLCVSALVQVAVVNGEGEAVYQIGAFWRDAHQMLHGGGVLGGLLGNACWQVIGFLGSLIVLIPGILILTLFLLGLTPGHVWKKLRYLWLVRAEERAEQREIRREREAERRAEEEELLAQQERERYARRLREQQAAERRQREAEAAAAAAGAMYTEPETLTVERVAPHGSNASATKKKHQNDFIDLDAPYGNSAPAAKKKHQNDFIDLDEPRGKKSAAKKTAAEDRLDFAKEDNLDEIMLGNERIARANTKKINQDVVIRPAEDEEPKRGGERVAATNEDAIPMPILTPSAEQGERPVPGHSTKKHADLSDLALSTVADVPAPEQDKADDPLAGLTNVAPVRKKKPADTPVIGVENDPDYYDLNNILKLQPTPEQEMKNTPEEAETELGLDIEITPVEDIKPAALPQPPKQAKKPQGGAVADAAIPENKKQETQTASAPVMTDASGAPIEEEEPEREYVFPPIDFLAMDTSPHDEDITEELRENAQRLMSTLTDFNVRIKEITYSRGPTITRYELKPDAGIRVRSIANLVDDIALSLATSGVRIEAPIPDKPAVGVEVPNRNRATVYLRDLIDSEKFSGEKSRLTAALGMDVAGKPVYFDISKMPHLLIAGATGMGKSVCINSLIVSLLYKARPDEVRLILIDPKKVEFNIYREIPLLYTPLVIDAKRAAATLACAVAEMERRFELIEKVGVRDIKGYNALTANDPEMEHLPHIVIIIDELAELMMVAKDQVETSICRIAQKARAAGMHLIIGTQRPSVDVITGVLKANIPSRIACTVASQVDSRTIIDIAGAEKLIGRGDMLFAPVGSAKPQRVQGAFVSEGEVETIVDYVRTNNSKVRYNRAFIENIEAEAARAEASNRKDDGDEDGGGENGDSLFENAVRVAIENNKISTSLLQRKLSIGYGRAAKLIDQMEELGYVSEADGNKPRRILLSKEMFMELVTNGTLEG